MNIESGKVTVSSDDKITLHSQARTAQNYLVGVFFVTGATFNSPGLLASALTLFMATEWRGTLVLQMFLPGLEAKLRYWAAIENPQAPPYIPGKPKDVRDEPPTLNLKKVKAEVKAESNSPQPTARMVGDYELLNDFELASESVISSVDEDDDPRANSFKRANSEAVISSGDEDDDPKGKEHDDPAT